MAAYSVIIEDSGTFAVQIQSEGKVKNVGGFKTEQEASEWMTTRQGSGNYNDVELSAVVRQQLEKAETGDTDAAQKLAGIRAADPAAADAAQQEASDGPKGLGLAR